MRLHLQKSDLEPERLNLILLVALFLAVGAMIFYVGSSFSEAPRIATFAGPVAAW